MKSCIAAAAVALLAWAPATEAKAKAAQVIGKEFVSGPGSVVERTVALRTRMLLSGAFLELC